MNELINFLITNFGYLFGAGGVFLWFLEKRKFVAEVDRIKADVAIQLESVQSNKIDNDIKLSSHYKEILDDLKQRYDTRFFEYDQMMGDKIKILKDEITLLRRQVRGLKAEIKSQDNLIKERDNQIKTLQKNGGHSTK
ncbi:MAG TPA: hypothetical protein VL022_04885 [Moheibacter sp.]|nr:hypothetical protein [Moheibacter sp.]